MASYNQIVDFLPQETQLMVTVKPPNDLKPELKRLLIKNSKDFPHKRDVYAVPLLLKAPLKIRFSISNQWNIQRELEKCLCTTPILPGKELESINGAYQAISVVIEPHRASRGGTVYTNIFFKTDDGNWMSLGAKRDKIYEPYREDYEEKVSSYIDRTVPYVKHHPAIDQFFQVLLDQKDKIVQALQAKNQDQIVQIQKLNEVLKQSKLSVYKDKIKELEQRLQEDCPEDSGSNSWQNWIYKNNWFFATQYAEPLPKENVGFHNIPDFLFPTLDGFIDVLKIKRPTFEVIEEDRSHHGSYKWSKEANIGIGQVVNYLNQIGLHQLEIVKQIEDKHSVRLSAVKPRGIILIGNSDKWTREKREALRNLNHSLHCIEVITYTDLLRRGKSLIAMYDKSSS